VLGVAYAPALDIRREKGYLFHTDINDTDARTGLFWKCPELVRVDNSTAWRAMSSVLTVIPRVVHPNDVYSAVVLCTLLGAIFIMCVGCVVMKPLARPQRRGRKRKVHLQRLIREEDGHQMKHGFCMYAEERLGKNIKFAGIMWETIEEVFQGIRTVMSGSGRARSGSFKLTWSTSLQQFREVRI
jgi:hypothetical protein